MVLKIALLQLLPGNNLEEQFKIGKAACEKAKDMDADIALFPEMWSDGYTIPQDEKAVNEFQFPLTAILYRDSVIWQQNCRWQLVSHFSRGIIRNH